MKLIGSIIINVITVVENNILHISLSSHWIVMNLKCILKNRKSQPSIKITLVQSNL